MDVGLVLMSGGGRGNGGVVGNDISGRMGYIIGVGEMMVPREWSSCFMWYHWLMLSCIKSSTLFCKNESDI